jgi:hypothetical protein
LNRDGKHRRRRGDVRCTLKTRRLSSLRAASPCRSGRFGVIENV